MILKKYQLQTLSVLRKYLEMSRLYGPAGAYNEIIKEPKQKQRLGRYAQEYTALNDLENIPYVCLRLPTGGGKTLLAARSIAVARDTWVEKDYPTVLWLVPTNTIRQQTVEALKNPRHPYRQQMDELFEGCVRVFDIGDFTQIRPQDIKDNLTVVVGTIQTLRVANTEGRKVYAHNEDMESHFSGISPTAPGLERNENSNEIIYSFANLLHSVHPILIVDEAHNAVTQLSREMETRISPSCIIEFTATPRLHSNILHNVTAQELKDEDMIKLPVVLGEHPNWQSAVDGAIQRRKQLEITAKGDKKYIRPIVLFQAQKKNEEVTVKVLKDYLVETSGIDEKKIAVATGEQREIDGINLFKRDCPIEFIITVEALKEGWDCSFAYIFCSVSRIQSATAVEQLLGRVLRMPYAERRKNPELNRAYAYVSETTFAQAANALRDKLVNMGFDEHEAALNIEREIYDDSQLDLDGGDFGTPRKPKPSFTEALDGEPTLEGLAESDQKAISVTKLKGGKFELTITGVISDKAAAVIQKQVPAASKKAFEEKVRAHKKKVENELPPAERGVTFSIPRLLFKVQGELDFADPEIFDEYHDWSLLDYPARLDEDEFQIKDEANTFEIDLDGKRLAISYASQDEQLPLEIEVEGWTENNLALALDKLVVDPRFSQSEKLKWCLDHVHYLSKDRGISPSALWRAKFVLARKLAEKINKIKAEEANKAYQRYLFEPKAKPQISFEKNFKFFNGMYEGQKPYRGNFKFRKHFLEFVPGFDGGEKGEEFQCAMHIDSIDEVKHWLRIIPKHPASFRLPLAQKWTYPDFVAELNDGRFLVVEYKGEHLIEKDREKRLIGEIWEKAMKGKGLYLWAVKDDNGKDVRTQLIEKARG